MEPVPATVPPVPAPPADGSGNPAGPPQPLVRGDFRRLLIAVGALSLGLELQATIVALQIYYLVTDPGWRPLALGMVGLAGAVPFLITALPAGHVADLVSRRLVMVCSTVALGGCSLALLLLSWRTPDALTVWLIFAVLAVSGMARAFVNPARSALVVELVPRDRLAAASALRSLFWQIGAIAGPAVGGLLYWLGVRFTAHGEALGGPRFAYVGDCLIMAVAVGQSVAIRHRAGAPARPPGESRSGEFLAGLRFAWGQPLLLWPMSLDLFAVFFGGAMALLPYFSDAMGAGSGGMGLMRAAPTAGAVAMSLILRKRRDLLLNHAGARLLWAVAGFGWCMIGFGLSRWLVVSVLLLAVSGALDFISVVIRTTMVQRMTPAHLQGRVSAVSSIFVFASNDLGDAESGLTARLLGPVRAVVAGGCMTLVVVATVAWRAPELRRMQRLD